MGGLVLIAWTVVGRAARRAHARTLHRQPRVQQPLPCTRAGSKQAHVSTEGIEHTILTCELLVNTSGVTCVTRVLGALLTHPSTGHSTKGCTRLCCVWAHGWWKHEAWQDPWHVDTHGCTNVLYKYRQGKDNHVLPHECPPHVYFQVCSPGESEPVAGGVFGTGISAACPQLIFLPDFWLLCQQDRLTRTSLDGC